MTQKTSPFVEASYGWDQGESNWNFGMDQNLLKFSFLFDRNIDGIVETLPAVVNGTAYFNTVDNKIYFAVEGAYYTTSVPKWFEVVNRADGIVYRFTGTSLEAVESAAAVDARLDARLDAVELTISNGASAISATRKDGVVSNIQDALDFKININTNFNVGVGGDFPTINSALLALSKMGKPQYLSGGLTVTLTLLSGFVLAEQVIIDKQDFGYVLILSQDAQVRIDHTVIAAGQVLTTLDSTAPAFGGRNYAILPVIGCLFYYDSNSVARDGVAVHFDSQARLMPGSGILNCRRGVQALYGSKITCYMGGLTQGEAGSGAGTVSGVKFPNCLWRACHIAFNSSCGLVRSDFSGCQATEAVYGIWAAHVDIYQSNISNSVGEAVYIRDGSKCNARETNVSGSQVGYHALHGATINARSRAIADGNIWIGNGARGCTQYGVLASYGSTVEAANLDVSNTPIGLNASNGSTINFTQGTAKACTNTAVIATDASTISANQAAVDGSATGFYAEFSSRINANLSTALLCTLRAFYSNAGSNICMEGASASVTEANEVVFSARGSQIDARGATVTGGTYGFRALEGSSINAYASVSSGATTFGFSAERGSTIAAGGSTGTTSPAVNTISAAGIIFK